MISTLKVGSTYEIQTMKTYEDALITEIDDMFVTFTYNESGVFKEKILRLDLIDNAFERSADDIKSVWYFGKVSGRDYGIRHVELSSKEIKINEERHVKLFYDEDSATDYLFNIALQESEEYRYLYKIDLDKKSLCRSESDNKWFGDLRNDFMKWHAAREEAKKD